MKNTLLLFALSATLFLAACEQSVIEEEIPEITAEEYLRAANLPPFVFQYVETDETTDQVRGWIITKEGEARAFEVAKSSIDVDFTEISRTYLDYLSDAADKSLGEVSLDDFVESIKPLRALAYAKTSTPSVDETQTQTAFFAAYTRSTTTTYNVDEESGCINENGHNTPPEISYRSILLESSGRVRQRNLNQQAMQIVHWLKTEAAMLSAH